MEFRVKHVLALLFLVFFYSFFIRVQGFDSALSQPYPIYYSEGAAHYYFTESIVWGGFLPEVDGGFQHPEGFRVFSRTPVFLYYLAAVYGLVCSKLGLGLYATTLFLSPLLYCTTIFTVYVLTRSLFGGVTPALVSASLYGVSMASVSRSTLAHFLYENMALPLLFLHLFFLLKSFDLILPKRMLLHSGLSGLFLFTALGSWYVSGFYLTVLIMCFTFLYFTGMRWDIRVYSNFGVVVLSAFAAYALLPHLPVNSIQLSLAFALIASVLVSNYRGLRLPKALVVYLLFLAFFVAQTRFSPDFSHVYAVFYHKIIQLLKWSQDIPYEVRMTWVCGYNSPSWDMIFSLFTLIPFGGLSLARHLLLWRRVYQKPQVKILVVMALAYSVLFLLAVRTIVFTVFFLAVFSGFCVAYAEKRFNSRLIELRLLVVGIIVLEAGLGYQLTAGSRLQYHPDAIGMIEYIKTNTFGDDVVLSSYFESSAIHAYAKRRVLLNPFWESAGLRRKVGFFDRMLFEGDAEYREIMGLYGVDVMAYNRGVCEGAPRFVGLTPADGSFIKSMCEGSLNSSLFDADYGNPSYFLIKPAQ